MSCLVNPYGWRLYFRQHWKVNFYINNKNFILLNHKSKILYEALNALFSRFNLNLKMRNFFRLQGFKVFIFVSNIFVLVKFRLNWSTLFKGLLIGGNKLLRRKGKIYYSNENKKPTYSITREMLRKAKKKNLFLPFFGETVRDFHLKENYLTTTNNKKYFKIFKLLLIHYSIVPAILTVKKLVCCINSRLFHKWTNTNLFFFNTTSQVFNPQSLLLFASLLLTKKKYSPIKTLYTVIRVMDKIRKKQQFRGYKILLAGRFSRRDRATYLWKTFGSVNLSSRLSSVEFFFKPIQLQYSRCVIKLWVCRV